MLSALKPVSDLQRVQHFDDYDLTANRSGLLSTRQRWRFVRARTAVHALGALTVFFIFALTLNELFLVPELTTIGIVLLLVLIGTFISLGLSLRPAFQKDVISIKGPLRKDFAIPLDSAPFEQVVIGPIRFYVGFELYEVLDEDAVYQVYYLKRGQRAGGNLLLSVELLEHAPEDDE